MTNEALDSDDSEVEACDHDSPYFQRPVTTLSQGSFRALETDPTLKEEGITTRIEMSETPSFVEASQASEQQPASRRIISPRKSPYFTPPRSPQKSTTQRQSMPTGQSCIPFAPIGSSSFGLLQESHFKDPLKLLIGVTFLNRTHGRDAIPVFYRLIDRYPTAEALASASKADIIEITRHLGLQSVRADTYIRFAKTWLSQPPQKARRYRVPNYPCKGDGVDVAKDEVLNQSDSRVGWEIGHITQGRYALDSWRIFCRDVLRGVAGGWNGEGAEDLGNAGLQPEWMRVVPEDKELRAFLRWMWLKEGFDWDPLTGEKKVASPELMRAAIDGLIIADDKGGLRIVEGEDKKILADEQERGQKVDQEIEVDLKQGVEKVGIVTDNDDEHDVEA